MGGPARRRLGEATVQQQLNTIAHQSQLASRIQAVSPLRRLVPYYYPYRGMLIAGLTLVVVSSALGAVVPWLLRSGIDALLARASLGRVAAIGGGIVAIALVGGALRFWMREVLNGLSRYIEYDLRQ